MSAVSTRERPILFSEPMICALIDGRKTQTRRIASKPVRHPDLGNLYAPGALVLEREPQHVIDRCCPYGRPGDRLWVRETFWAFGHWRRQFSKKKLRDEWVFLDATRALGHNYRFRDPEPNKRYARGSTNLAWWKRPSIHMPSWASRITLEITAVHIERLQQISRADAQAEGCEHDDPCDHTRRSCADIACQGPDYRVGFRNLWELLNGPGSWNANPWVWVIEFAPLEILND